MKKVFLLLVTIFFISCDKKKDVENYLIGLRWEILEITHKDQNYEPYLTFSSYKFEENGNCSTPMVRLKKGFQNKNDRFAKWSLIDVNRIKIESKKEYLNGEFTLCLNKDYQNKFVYITIESDELYVKAYRVLGKGFNEPIPSTCK